MMSERVRQIAPCLLTLVAMVLSPNVAAAEQDHSSTDVLDILDSLLSTTGEYERIRAIQDLAENNHNDREIISTLHLLSLQDPSAAVRTAARNALLRLSPPSNRLPPQTSVDSAALLREWRPREEVLQVDDELEGSPTADDDPAQNLDSATAGSTQDASDSQTNSEIASATTQSSSTPLSPKRHTDSNIEQATRIASVDSAQPLLPVSAQTQDDSEGTISLVPLPKPLEDVPGPTNPEQTKAVRRPPPRLTEAQLEPISPQTESPNTPAALPTTITEPGAESQVQSPRIESVESKVAPVAVPIAKRKSAIPTPIPGGMPVPTTQQSATRQRPSLPDRTTTRLPAATTPPRPSVPTAVATVENTTSQPKAQEPTDTNQWIELDRIPRDPAERKQMAKDLLSRGRQLLQENRIDEAEALLFQAREFAVDYHRLEYSPKSLSRDIAVAREAARKKLAYGKHDATIRR